MRIKINMNDREASTAYLISCLTYYALISARNFFSVKYNFTCEITKLWQSSVRPSAKIKTVLSPPCKRTQHCWPITPKIVGCYVLRPFAHPVACCCMFFKVVTQSLKSVKRLAPCKRTTQNLQKLLGQQCWELLRTFARSFKIL